MTTENKNQPAFATSSPSCDRQDSYLQEGLTKREYFAALAMQGFLANNLVELNKPSVDCAVDLSIKAADELLKQLEETK